MIEHDELIVAKVKGDLCSRRRLIVKIDDCHSTISSLFVEEIL